MSDALAVLTVKKKLWRDFCNAARRRFCEFFTAPVRTAASVRDTLPIYLLVWNLGNVLSSANRTSPVLLYTRSGKGGIIASVENRALKAFS